MKINNHNLKKMYLNNKRKKKKQKEKKKRKKEIKFYNMKKQKQIIMNKLKFQSQN